VDEAEALVKEKESVERTVKANRERIEVLVNKLGELRKQVKPVDRDVRSRHRDERDKGDSRDVKRGSEERMDLDAGRDGEEGIQIRGEDGDVEVEY
jgi:hypothetical protein